MPKSGKNAVAASAKVDREAFYSPEEAIALMRDASYAKFDETVEMHARLGIDPRQADQAVRTTVTLPHGTGSTVRVLVFAQGEAARLAEEAGADFVGGDELIAQMAPTALPEAEEEVVEEAAAAEHAVVETAESGEASAD